MSLIEWNEDMKLGVAEVDFEHHVLIAAINKLGGLLQSGRDGAAIQNVLGQIHAKIERHFALEEKIMRDRQYSGYEAHKEDHDRLLEQIREIMDDAAKADEQQMRTALSQRLTLWFSEHFRTLDRSFHNFESAN